MYTYKHAHPHILTHVHTHACMYTRAHPHVRPHTCMCKSIYIPTCACMSARTHTHRVFYVKCINYIEITLVISALRRQRQEDYSKF